MAVNATFRSGFIESRPGWWKVQGLNYPSDVSPDNSGTAAKQGLFQGATVYRPIGSPACLIASISGRQFRYNVVGNMNVSEITPRFNDGTIDRNSKWRDIAYFKQAEQFLFTQDGQSSCMIYDGGQNRRAITTGDTPEIPPGTVMEYVQGRVWMARPDRRSFIAGNIVGDTSSGTAAYGFKDSVFKFSDNNFLNEGGDFSIPTDAGLITAMRSPPLLDSSQGQGPLQVFTERAGFSVNTPVDRATWKDVTYPIETKSLESFGPTSHRGMANVNSDPWFRAQDGIRSFLIARRDFAQNSPFTMTWANTPMSREMERIVAADDPSQLKYVSTVLFDNRLLVTCVPRRTPYGTVFRGLVALDFAPISGMQQKKPPAWDGLWTGLQILQVLEGDFDGVSRCFAFVLNSSNQIEIWELTKNQMFDQAEFNIPTVIQSSMDSRSYDFGDGGQLLKELTGACLWRDRILGLSQVTLSFLPDQYAFFQQWNPNGGSTQTCATSVDCRINLCQNGPASMQPQYRSRLTFPQPVDDCEPISSRPYRVGYEFTVRLAFSACRIKMFRMYCKTIQEPEFIECPENSEVCVDLAGCIDDYLGYTITGS